MEAKAKRKIRPGREYDRYFPVSTLKRTDGIIVKDGDVYDTLVQMKKIIRKTLADTQGISKVLKGNSLEATCSNIWDFVYNHIQYVLDKQGVEQLRRPARAWADRNSGVDCDCYSIFISSILTNMGISHRLRMAKYKGDWQHVYVIVPSGPKKYITIDCVVDQFNYEVPFSDKHDTEMGMPIQFLDGLDDTNANVVIPRPTFGQEFAGFGQVGLGTTSAPVDLRQDMLDRLKMHLLNTRDMIAGNPALKKELGEFGSQVQYLLANWDDDNARTMALAQLEEYETRMGLNGFGGLFSKIGDAIKSATKAVGTGISNAASWTADKTVDAAKAVATGVKNAAEWTADKAKDVAEAVVKYNPLSIAIRNGVLLAFKLNLFRMAERLGYAYWTEAEAAKNGLNVAEWRKLKEVHGKVVKIWEGLQGDLESLKKNIKQGWEHGTAKHNLPRGNGISGFGIAGLGYSGLGDGGASAAAVASATPVIATITGLLTAVGGLFLAFKPDYSKDNKVPDDYIPPSSEEEYNANPDNFDPNSPNYPKKSDNTLIYIGVAALVVGYAYSQQS